MAYYHYELLRFITVLTLASVGGGATPHELSEIATEPLGDRAEILLSLWGILSAILGKKKLTGSCQVTEI